VSVYVGKRVTVDVDDGKEIVRVAPAVAVVAVDADGSVVLVRQQRPAVGGPVLELPAGLLDPGEHPLTAAQRELREETGLHGGVFVATGLEEGDDDPDPGEDVEIVRVPQRDLPGLVDEIEDAKTLAGLLLYLRER